MLSNQEIKKIESFCKDEKMFNAVKKVLLQGIYVHGVSVPDAKPDPLKNGAFSLVSLTGNYPVSDEVLGQQLRAQWAGVNALENALVELKNIKTKVDTEETQENEAI